MARRTKLTPEVQKVIVDAIASGAFDWVAAQAAGIHPETFRRWMRAGEAGGEYADFAHEVKVARCGARKVAEATVFRENPLAWLRFGPGRERAGEPGWTESQQITGEGGGPIQIHDMEAVRRDRWTQVVPALAQALGMSAITAAAPGPEASADMPAIDASEGERGE